VQLKIVLKEETPSRTSDRQSLNFVQRDISLQIIWRVFFARYLAPFVTSSGLLNWLAIVKARRIDRNEIGTRLSPPGVSYLRLVFRSLRPSSRRVPSELTCRSVLPGGGRPRGSPAARLPEGRPR
jgi:hypothetical protein